MNKSIQAFGFIILFLSLMAIIIPLYLLYDQGDNYTIKKVPCYDENQNKMIDIMCEEKEYEGGDKITLICIIIGVILIFFGIWVYSRVV